MKAKRIIMGAILVLIAVWIYFTMTAPSVKYFGGITLMIIGLLVLFSGFKKESKESLAPPEPMAPDEHTPGYKSEEHTHNLDKQSK